MQLSVLKRLGRYLAKQGKLTSYSSFIMSNFNYCPVAWHFCSMTSTKKMEKIQEKALRFINDDFELPLRDLLVSNNTDFLHIGRMKLMAREVFKILHQMSPEYIQDLNYHFRKKIKHRCPELIPQWYGLRTFRYEASRIWNNFPNEIRAAESYPQFRRMLRTWTGPICKCPLCMYDLMFVTLLMFVLCLMFVSSFFMFQFPVLFYFTCSCCIPNVLVLHVLLFLCIALTHYFYLY